MSIRGATLGNSGHNGRPEHAVAYRWRGEDGWDPAALGPIRDDPGRHLTKLEAGREARLREFTGYRAEGWTAAEAGELVGVTRDTANAYERNRKERAAAAGGAS